VLVAAAIWSAEGSAATRVPLRIDEPSAGRTVAWPITTGVPFPRGALVDDRHCRLVDDRGEEQRLQTWVAATWDAARSSIRWLTIDFIAQPGRSYVLEFGSDVRRQDPSPVLQVTPGISPRVTTGVLEAEFRQSAPAALHVLRMDLDRDGIIGPDERVLAGSASGDHAYVDQLGRRFSSAGDGAAREVEVEVAGPVRACVRVDGFYTGPDGQRQVAYRTRFHFFAGLSLVKLVDEFRVVASTRDTRFQEVTLDFELPLATAGRHVAADALAEEPGRMNTLPWSNTTRSVSLVQETYRHYGNPECIGYLLESDSQNGTTIHASAERTGPWLSVADGRAAVTGSARWFWQQFPKEWQVTENSLRFHLWSGRAG
jgi:hypothetical protein